MDAIAQTHQATAALDAVIGRIRELMAQRGSHAARTVVLVPYVHLIPVAMKAWAQQVRSGFAPRFETTQTWSGSRAFVPGVDDMTFDMGRDLLTARSMLERAGLRARADLLTGRLVEAASQLAGVAAAVTPAERSAWSSKASAVVSSGLDAPALALESAVGRIAVAWASTSAYATDSLFESDDDGVDLLVVVRGLRAEPVADALLARFGDKGVACSLDADVVPGEIRLHCADDPSDEAERAAACVIRHLEAGRAPVALAAIDRVLTRRVRAMLDGRGIAVRDETGWKLSTTRAAAHVMLALRACAWNPGSDAVIDWLKNCESANRLTVLALERRVRREGWREWRTLDPAHFDDAPGPRSLVEKVAAWREALRDNRPIPHWLAALRGLMHDTGQWHGLEQDAAGSQLITALRLDELAQAELQSLPQAARRISLAEFTSWVNDTLEAATFVPEAPDEEQVVILPFNQLLARPFPAAVLAGCDEEQLPASPEPSGLWTPAQREALGLPTRAVLQAEARTSWRNAFSVPVCDVLWRAADDDGEPLLPSLLVQALQFEGLGRLSTDPRSLRRVEGRGVPKPHAIADALPLQQLSASAYEDLRRCPYRFFALRQLGLQEADEIDLEVGKRDFGNWLHRVLSRFHQAMHEREVPPSDRCALIDGMAREVTQSMRFDEGDFLPFEAAWPRVRDGYLDWLTHHESREGARFLESESRHEAPVGAIRLVGQVDRIDALPGGGRMVLDYKTESAETTRSRVREPAEDTQLAFYAALLRADELRAAYVNVGERKTETIEQKAVLAARDLLVEGLLEDLRRIGEGAGIAALGEGKVCDFCAARGLCRRDSWS